MDVFRQMLSLQAQMFLLMLLGALMAKLRIIGEAGRKTLSALLLDLILPCNIVCSFLGGTGATPEFFKNCLLALVICTVIQTAAILGSRLAFRRYPREKKGPMSYGMICSNSSFVGMPVANALYGGMGVMYTSIFQIPIRFTMWTAGLHLFTQVERRQAVKMTLTHPCNLAVFLGLALMLLGVELPAFAMQTLTGLSGCCIPVSMLVIGSVLAGTDVRSLFSWPVLWFSLLRLVVFPLAVYGVLSLLPVDPLLTGISVLMSGMPAGSTTSILAEQYGCGSLFASQLVFASTLFSIATLPLLCLLL